jgi:hypothetical protein
MTRSNWSPPDIDIHQLSAAANAVMQSMVATANEKYSDRQDRTYFMQACLSACLAQLCAGAEYTGFSANADDFLAEMLAHVENLLPCYRIGLTDIQ